MIVTTNISARHEARLTLPLSAGELDKALTDVGVLTGSRKEYVVSNTGFYHNDTEIRELIDLADRTKDIFELNYLAEKLQGFDHQEIDRFNEILTALGGGVYNAIDLATHYDSIALYADIYDYRDLGVEFLKHNSKADPSQMHDSYLIECGKYAAKTMGGIFLHSGCFVGFPREFIRNKYAGRVLPDANVDDNAVITMFVGKRGYGVRPNTWRFRDISLEVPEEKISIPLNAGAAFISRVMERQNINPDTPWYLTRVRYSFKPDDLKIFGGIYSDRIGEVSEIAHHYTAMDAGQRTVFCSMIEEMQRKADMDVFAGRGKQINPCGIVRKYGLLERMERDHGYVPPRSDAPVTMVLQRARDSGAVTAITLPASQTEIDSAVCYLGVPEEEVRVRSFSLDINSGQIQRMIGDGMTVSEISREIQGFSQEQTPTMRM